MEEVQIVKFIKTRLKLAGDGKSKDDPFRIIEQYWDFEGNLIFEYDSFTKKISYYDSQSS